MLFASRCKVVTIGTPLDFNFEFLGSKNLCMLGLVQRRFLLFELDEKSSVHKLGGGVSLGPSYDNNYHFPPLHVLVEEHSDQHSNN